MRWYVRSIFPFQGDVGYPYAGDPNPWQVSKAIPWQVVAVSTQGHLQ